jgi:hypothetical protein
MCLGRFAPGRFPVPVRLGLRQTCPASLFADDQFTTLNSCSLAEVAASDPAPASAFGRLMLISTAPLKQHGEFGRGGVGARRITRSMSRTSIGLGDARSFSVPETMMTGGFTCNPSPQT